jgi:hypothetical protein
MRSVRSAGTVANTLSHKSAVPQCQAAEFKDSSVAG